MKIVFASSNEGKVAELHAMLMPYHLEVIPQRQLGVEDVPETGLTFVENAIIKARHAAQVTGLPALADDSGLEVAALNGAPGIYSARYAGEHATSKDNIQKLLQALQDVPSSARKARFHCVLVLLTSADDPTPLICQGSWEGVIVDIPSGTQGFGYDPVFFDPIHQCTAAELSSDIKNSISHRGRALRLLMEKISEKI